VVTITPQLPEYSITMTERHDLGFDLLSDPGSSYAKSLGLVFTLADDLREVYLSLGIDLPKHNGEASWTLPMPGPFRHRWRGDHPFRRRRSGLHPPAGTADHHQRPDRARVSV
jgi:hypothetical protein